MKKCYVDERIKVRDRYLDEVIETYKVVRNKTNTKEDDDRFFDSFNDIFKVLAYRDIVFPVNISFLDSKTQYLFNKGKMKDWSECKDNALIYSQLYEIRPKGSKEEYDKYVIIFSNVEKAFENKLLTDTNALLSYTFNDVYDEFVKKANEKGANFLGIILNPNTDDIMLPLNMCEYIYNGCKKEEWEELIKPVREALNRLTQ